jgi:hypothetical protein
VSLLYVAPEPEAAPSWPKVVRDALRAGAKRAYLLTIQSASGALKYCLGPVSSLSLGHFHGRILDGGWPLLTMGVSEVASGIASDAFDVSVDDSEGALAMAAEGSSRLRRARAYAMLAVDGVDPRLWPALFTGIVDDWHNQGYRRATIALRHDDIWLRGEFPKKTVGLADWPNAPSESLNKVYPAIYGNHVGASGDGSLPCLPVDDVKFRFLIMGGHWLNQSTAAVFKDGALQTSGYSFEFPVLGGNQVTLVRLAADPGSSVITVDGFGIEDFGDGTGAPITTPAAQLLHLITNFLWGNYSAGPWADPTLVGTPVDVESFLETDDYLMGSGMRPRGIGGLNPASVHRSTGRYYGQPMKSWDALTDFAEGTGCKLFWTEQGKLAVRPQNHRDPRIYVYGPFHLPADAEDLGEFQQPEDTSSLLDRVAVRYSFDEVAGEAMANVEVADPDAGWDVGEDKENNWPDHQVDISVSLSPNAITQNVGWTALGAASLDQAIDDPVGSPDDAGTYVQDPATVQTFRFAVPSMPPASRVGVVTLNWRGRYVPNGGGGRHVKVGLYVGTLAYYDSPVNLTSEWTTYASTWARNPATGARWTKADVDALEYVVHNVDASADLQQITQAWVFVTYTGEFAVDELAREIASKELNLRRDAIEMTKLGLPSYRGGVQVLGPVAISSALARGGTWGVRPWERRLHTILERQYDPNQDRILLKALDERTLRVGLWETDGSELGAANIQARGVARLGSWRGTRYGSTRTRDYKRDGRVWIETLSGQVIQLDADLEAYDRRGLALEDEGSNEVVQSSFVNSLVGWTRNGIGQSGSAILLDAAEPTIFEEKVGANVVRLLAPSVGGVANDIELVSTPTAPFDLRTSGSLLAIDRRDDLGFPLAFWLLAGTFYWDEAANNWSLTKVWNQMPVSRVAAPFRSGIFKPPSGPVAYQVGIGYSRTSYVPSQVNHVYHIQLERDAAVSKRPWAGTRVVTEAAPVSRSAATLTYFNFHEARAYDHDHGSALLEVEPMWNSAEVAAYTFSFFVVRNDSDLASYDTLLYQGSTGRLIFRRSVAGASFDAAVPATFVRGTRARVGCRWTGLEGELGLAPRTLDVFFEGAKGTSVVAAAHSYLRTPYKLTLGAVTGFRAPNAYLWRRRIVPFVYTDQEMARLR